MDSSRHYDLIIIGTGAGGGALAHRLAGTGKKILLLERGGFLPREKDNWESRAVFVEAKYRAQEPWHDGNGNPFFPGIQYYVGGNTKFYGAALFRLREKDFQETRHAGGVSPAWPFSYQDFEPYYTQAEGLFHVHGKRGEDPTEPPASRDYFYPPVSHEPRIAQLAADLRRLGCHPYAMPLGILLEEENGRPRYDSACVRCPAFDGFPCLVRGKADAQVLCIEPALKYPNVTLLTHAYAERLETDAGGKRVAAVHVRRGGDAQGAEEIYSADIVVAACGAINSAALLLRSANSQHPQGLANSSGMVGRHYMRHNNSAFMAISREPNPTVFQKTLALADFYWGAKDYAYPLGLIQMLGKSDGEMLKGEAPAWAGDLAPEFTLDKLARHGVDFWLTTEDLPDADNRISLDRDGGIVLDLRHVDLEPHRRLTEKLKGLLGDVGMHPHLLPRTLYLGKQIPIGGTAHQAGTARFGRDAKTSVLDVNCRAHDLDNLYVVDGAFMVSVGAVNPALTIVANALRVGDHLRQRLGSA
ncbi:MAG: GMC oxidoreductase [Terriglobales bacterium]